MDDHLPAVCCQDHAAMAVLPLIRENGDARVSAERERIRAAVEGLGEASPDRLRWDGLLDRAAVLAIVEGKP